MEARYYLKDESGSVWCLLCPHLCSVPDGKSGRCGIRYNNGDQLEAAGYGLLSSIALDPVEKKPLYHFYPGRRILSVGSFGCNLSCDFCQNHEISQIVPPVSDIHRRIRPEDLVQKASEAKDNLGVAYTYNEPVISYEFVLDSALLLKQKSFKVVMVSNGFIEEAPLRELLPATDAWNIDLKSFSEGFYKVYCKGRLRPVLRSIELVRGSGAHLELTTLIIPGRNDTPDEMKDLVSWISDHCGRDTVLHLSRYFPRYHSSQPPTPVETMKKLFETAASALENVYAGNLNEGWGKDSRCPKCGTVYITREGYRVTGLPVKDNSCPSCGYKLYGKF